jgi:hypothetical protein
MVLNWGDQNTSTINGNGATEVFVYHTYASNGNYDLSLDGDTDYMTSINLGWQLSKFYGDISFWGNRYTALESISVFGNGADLVMNVTGNISNFSKLPNLSYLDTAYSNVDLDLSYFKDTTTLTFFTVNNCPGVHGDASTLKSLINLTALRVDNTTNVTFNSQDAWVGHNHTIFMDDCNFSSGNVDNALIAFSGGNFASKLIQLDGTNGARTSLSDTAKSVLLAANNTVTVNE